MSFSVHGVPVSGGIAIGRAHLLSRAGLEVAHYMVPKNKIAAEVTRFDDALATVHEKWERRSLAERLKEIFSRSIGYWL